MKEKSKAETLPPTTAGINPEQFSDDLFFARNRKIAAVILALFLLIGFALRVNDLGAESLGEDELNKLQTVEDYRTNGLSGKNGEHPFLMKGLQLVSVVATEKLNNYVLPTPLRISDEASIRFPIALFGTFISLLIFLLMSELFGRGIGLVSAVLWTVEPIAIGFDRIAKEDSLALFFLLLTCLFWVRGQTAAERSENNWVGYAWAAAVSFAAMMASKYYPFFFAVPLGYYTIFQRIPATKWRLGKARFIKFFVIMIVSFVVINPTILLPDTWREMRIFSSGNRIGHDSYEFMGVLYQHLMSNWFAGVPWTFYFVFLGVKTSLSTLGLFLVGLPMAFRRKMGDGRYLLFFWAFIWLITFTFMGGKFTRYVTIAEPLVVTAAAIGFCVSVRWLSQRLFRRTALSGLVQTLLFAVVVAAPLLSSLSAAPYFRLYVNPIGGGTTADSYFPQDDYYDTSSREIVARIADIAPAGATVASETPALFEYYVRRTNRSDLIFVSLSDKTRVAALRSGDLIVLAKGRRYLSNTAYQDYLERSATPAFEIKAHDLTSAKVYQMTEASLADIQALAK